MAELATAGFPTRSLAELRQSGTPYGPAVPVLLRWLSLTENPALREEIVRALSVPWAKPVATARLVEEFRTLDAAVDPSGLGLRWTVGNALEVLYEDEYFAEYAQLALDGRYGAARQMVVLGLGKSRRPEAADVLIALIDDPDVDGHAVKALGKLKVPSGMAALERKLDDPRAWVRAAARRALSRFSG